MTDQNATERYGGALLIPEITDDAPMIETATAARALAEPGLTKDAAAALWHNLLASGLIHPRGRKRTGRRAYSFDAGAVVVAAVMYRLSEAGIVNADMRHAVSLALNTWRGEDIGITEDDFATGNTARDVPRSPAMWALVEYLNGTRNLSFQVRTLRCTKSGGVAYACRDCDAEGHGSNFPAQPESYSVRSVILIGLDDPLAHITRAKHTHETTPGAVN
jgi:hypothetical protein